MAGNIKNLLISIKTLGAKKSEKEIKGLSASIGLLAKATAIATSAFFGTKKLINAFSQQEMAEKKLEAALGKTSEALLNQASALQRVSMFGDEQIIVQQAFLASLKFTEEQIKTIIPAAIDLSAATGIALDSAVRNLAKTYSGLQGELGELIPQLRELTTTELQQGEAVKVVSDLMGGQGKKQTETMTGSIQQMKMATGDLAEELGEKLAPTVIKVTKAITAFIKISETDLISGQSREQLEDFIKMLEDQRAEFEILMNQGIAPARQAYVQYTKQIEEAKNKLKEMNGVIESETTIFATEHDLLRIRNELLSDGVMSIQDQIDINETHLESVKEQTRQGLNVIANKKKELELEGKLVELRTALKDATVSSTSDMIGAFGQLNQASKGNALVSARLAQTAAVIDMYAGANKAFAQGGVLGFVSAGAIIASGMANVLKIEQSLGEMQSAETGFDGIVNRPTMFMTGEGNKAERVSVTPLQGPNINGPQGGITLNITAPLIDEHILDTIIPAIQRAQRMNLA